jgi:hypothetical protein
MSCAVAKSRDITQDKAINVVVVARNIGFSPARWSPPVLPEKTQYRQEGAVPSNVVNLMGALKQS